MTKPAETPEFLFERRPDVEAAHGFLLVGILTINIPKAPVPPEERHQPMVHAIIKTLITAAEANTMPADGLTIGWHGDGAWPANAIDINDDDAIAEWRERSLTFLVRVSVRDEDGQMRGQIRIPVEDEDEDEPGPTLH